MIEKLLYAVLFACCFFLVLAVVNDQSADPPTITFACPITAACSNY